MQHFFRRRKNVKKCALHERISLLKPRFSASLTLSYTSAKIGMLISTPLTRQRIRCGGRSICLTASLRFPSASVGRPKLWSRCSSSCVVDGRRGSMLRIIGATLFWTKHSTNTIGILISCLRIKPDIAIIHVSMSSANILPRW